LRVLQIIESAHPNYGGPIEAARRFGSTWIRNGHTHDLLTLDPVGNVYVGDYPGKIIALGPTRGRSIRKLYRYSPLMVPWLEENAGEYDAVIVSGLWRYMSRAARVALAGSSTPYFVYTHGMLDPWFRKRYPFKHLVKQISWWWAEGPLLANAAAVLFTCEEEKSLAANAFWPYKANGITVGYGTADVAGDSDAQIAAFRSEMPQLGTRRYLLFLSRVHEKKGCDLLIEAFAKIMDWHGDLDLVIAGPDQSGLVATLKQQAERLGASERIHFPGMLLGDSKIGAYRDCEAFVLTSHQENFGIVVAEAMACEKPVLISNKVNIWREIEEDGAGLVDDDTFAGALRLLKGFLAMDEAEQSAMGARARQSFLSRFHVEQAAARVMSLMSSFVDRRPAGLSDRQKQ
jgi:glycosyltransferase involved in cell wall biosynthesis